MTAYDEWIGQSSARHAPEVDFGTTWTTAQRPDVNWRLQLEHRQPRAHRRHPTGDEVERLGWYPSIEEAARVVSDWVQLASQPGGLDTMRSHIRRLERRRSRLPPRRRRLRPGAQVGGTGSTSLAGVPRRRRSQASSSTGSRTERRSSTSTTTNGTVPQNTLDGPSTATLRTISPTTCRRLHHSTNGSPRQPRARRPWRISSPMVHAHLWTCARTPRRSGNRGRRTPSARRASCSRQSRASCPRSVARVDRRPAAGERAGQHAHVGRPQRADVGPGALPTSRR